jgi:hypothetical protein
MIPVLIRAAVLTAALAALTALSGKPQDRGR